MLPNHSAVARSWLALLGLEVVLCLILPLPLPLPWIGSEDVNYDSFLFTIAGLQSGGAALPTHPTLRLRWIASWAGSQNPTVNRGNPGLSKGHGRSGLLRRIVIRAAWVGLGLVALGWCMGWWITSRAKPHCHRGVNSAPNRTVAIVPGALMYSGGAPSVTLRDRLATARDLYRLGKVRRILVSGDHSRANYDEVNPSRRWLLAQGVMSAHILMDHAGLRTLDTMVRARWVFGVTDATICTQAFHLPRAVFLARRAGIDAVGVVADRRIYTVHNQNRFREFFARPKAFLDTYVLRTRPRNGGPTIPILGDARLTHDQWTRPTPEK